MKERKGTVRMDKSETAVLPSSGVLFVGHGTRDEAGIREFERLVEYAKASLRTRLEWSSVPVEHCFLELHQTDIQTGVARLVEAGAKDIVVIPVLLFSAGHHKEDIPNALKQAQARFEGIRFQLDGTVGLHPLFLEVARDRLAESGIGRLLDGLRSSHRVTVDASAVLLVGRGSNDPEASKDFYHVARALRLRLPGLPLFTCTLTGIGRSFEEGLDACVSLGPRNVYVLPYLLFQGFLTRQLREKSDAWMTVNRNARVQIAQALGPDARIGEWLSERAAVLLNQRKTRDFL